MTFHFLNTLRALTRPQLRLNSIFQGRNVNVDLCRILLENTKYFIDFLFDEVSAIDPVATFFFCPFSERTGF